MNAGFVLGLAFVPSLACLMALFIWTSERLEVSKADFSLGVILGFIALVAVALGGVFVATRWQ